MGVLTRMLIPLVALLAAPPEAEEAATPEPAEELDFTAVEAQLNRHTRERYAADLDEIRRRGVLRVLTVNNSVSYFIARGQERGFEFELASAFAEALGVRVAFVVPERRGDLIGALLEGEGDLIAAGTSLTPARAEKLAFTRPFLEVRRVVATHADAPVEQLEDLLGRPLHVSFRSSTLADARWVERKLGRSLSLVDVEDGVEMERMMERVADGTYRATIVDDNLLALEQAAGFPIVGELAVGDPIPKAWAVHPAAPELLAAADAFVQKEKRLIAILRGRYMRPSRVARLARSEEFRADLSGRISPFDHLFRLAGEQERIDWRLLAALAFAESKFDPKAESRFGARGLMQLLPTTAARVGVTKLFDPKQNILAGARYLARLMKIFEADGVEPRQQIRFALAAYNAGLGHIFDGRDLARRTGRDPNKWFNHVADAMRLKEQPKWHRSTRYGYSRARETIAYVSRIQAQYDIFARHVPLDPVDPAEATVNR